MSEIDYASAPIKVRDDITEAHRRAWQRIAAPGTWWTGKDRVAIAAEVRNAVKCALCKERKAAGTFDKQLFLDLEEVWQLLVKTGVAGTRAKAMVDAELQRMTS